MEQAATAGKSERTWAMLCHLSALAGFIVGIGYIIAPLVIWLIKKDQYPLVNDQGKESVNFQISMTIYAAVAAVLVLIAIGIPLLFAILVFDIIQVIIASIRANEGIAYRYPLTIRLIK